MSSDGTPVAVANFTFCKHMSAGHRPMIDQGPVADQKLLRSHTDLSIFFSDTPTLQKSSDVQISYGDRRECDCGVSYFRYTNVT